MTKGEGCATGVDRLTTRADVCTSKGDDCETIVDNWNPDENGYATETEACVTGSLNCVIKGDCVTGTEGCATRANGCFKGTEDCVISLKCFFRNTSAFKNNLRNIGQIFPSFSWRLLSHVARLDQSHKRKYLTDYNTG